MAPAAQSQTGPGMSTTLISTTLSVLLVVVITITACVARRTEALAAIRENVQSGFDRIIASGRPRRGLGTEAVQSFPVTQYHRSPAPSAKKGGRSTVTTTLTAPSALVPRWLPRITWVAATVLLATKRAQKPQPAQLGQEDATQSCSICTEDFAEGVDVRRLPCGHIFHTPCIDPWLTEFAVTCPLWCAKAPIA